MAIITAMMVNRIAGQAHKAKMIRDPNICRTTVQADERIRSDDEVLLHNKSSEFSDDLSNDYDGSAQFD
jgi:hypothetical protein